MSTLVVDWPPHHWVSLKDFPANLIYLDPNLYCEFRPKDRRILKLSKFFWSI